jgi:hypothetical protein
VEEQLATALIARLQPILYIIGLVVVFIFVSFGGTIISLWVKSRDKQSSKLEEILGDLKRLGAQHTLEIGKLETKLQIYIEKYDKDLRNLSNKIKNF